MILLRSLLPAAAVALVLGGCGGSGDDTTSTPATSAPAATATTSPTTAQGTATTAKKPEQKIGADQVKQDGKVTSADVELIDTNLARVTAECVERRNKSGQVGGVSQRFRNSVEVLVAEFKDTPEKSFKLPASDSETSMHDILSRLGTTLATPAPDGCGANVKGKTDGVSKQIRAALIGARQSS